MLQSELGANFSHSRYNMPGKSMQWRTSGWKQRKKSISSRWSTEQRLENTVNSDIFGGNALERIKILICLIINLFRISRRLEALWMEPPRFHSIIYIHLYKTEPRSSRAYLLYLFFLCVYYIRSKTSKLLLKIENNKCIINRIMWAIG